MNQKTSEYRKKIADQFVKCLQERELDWKRGWDVTSSRPQNAVTNSAYKGLNRFYLSLYAMENKIEDPRWATFNQIKKQGWKLRKGAKGMQVEYWSPYDYANKKLISWSDYDKLMMDPDKKAQVGIIAKYYYVFNAKDIEGIHELPKMEKREIVTDQLIRKISEKMGVEIKNEGDRAFYKVTEDKIYLPFKESFHSDYEYNTVALHELSHASGAEKRLDRSIKNAFGTEQYAYEELVAEISSCFMSEHLQMEQTQLHIDNHKAYVQSWITAISEKPDTLIKAIKDADAAANYLEYQADLISEKDYYRTISETEVVSDKEMVPQTVLQQIKADIAQSGYQATDGLVSNLHKLSVGADKACSLKEVQHTYRNMLSEHTQNQIINEIAQECKQQELAKMLLPER